MEQVSCKLPNNEHTYVHNTVLGASPWPFWLKLRRQPMSIAVGGGTIAVGSWVVSAHCQPDQFCA